MLSYGEIGIPIINGVASTMLFTVSICLNVAIPANCPMPPDGLKFTNDVVVVIHLGSIVRITLKVFSFLYICGSISISPLRLNLPSSYESRSTIFFVRNVPLNENVNPKMLLSIFDIESSSIIFGLILVKSDLNWCRIFDSSNPIECRSL